MASRTTLVVAARSRRTSTAAALAGLALLLTGATACSPSEAPTVAAEPSGQTSAAPSAEPTPEPVTESPEPAEPAQIVLTAGGIGDVAIGTPAALPTLLALLGPAKDDGTGIEQPGSDECGGPEDPTSVSWGGLQVTFTGGALYGWRAQTAVLPPNTVIQHGILPGAPYTDVTALPGAPAAEYQDGFGRLSRDVDGIGYWSSDGSDPATTTLAVITVNPITCS